MHYGEFVHMAIENNRFGIGPEKGDKMIVKQRMQKKVISVLPSSSIHDAAIQMKKQKVGTVLVMEDGNKLKGILTDRDITMAVAENKDPNSTSINKIMKKKPITIKSDADIMAALRVMSTGNVRRLPVCERGEVIGMLSSADLASEIREELDQFMSLEEAIVKH
jgi:CBS domain-containing protein